LYLHEADGVGFDLGGLVKDDPGVFGQAGIITTMRRKLRAESLETLIGMCFIQWDGEE